MSAFAQLGTNKHLRDILKYSTQFKFTPQKYLLTCKPFSHYSLDSFEFPDVIMQKESKIIVEQDDILQKESKKLFNKMTLCKKKVRNISTR